MHKILNMSIFKKTILIIFLILVLLILGIKTASVESKRALFLSSVISNLYSLADMISIFGGLART